MIKAFIKPNTYQDSVNLMLLSSALSRLEGVNAVSIMMGTPANKELFRNANLWAEELAGASPTDLCIVVHSDDPVMAATVVEEVEAFLAAGRERAEAAGYPVSRTWESALRDLPDANLALISLPGKYAATEADKALDKGLSVFLFSDNVSLEREVALKRKAREKGLLVMGPDCGTASLGGLPIAFANAVRKGSVGLAAASGTGLQEVMVGIHRLGGGISQAFGLGGRDLSAAVGGVTARDALLALAADEETKVVVLISKPAAPEVRDVVMQTLKSTGKPAVALFMGEPARLAEGRVRFAATLDEAARLAMECVRSLDEPPVEAVFPRLPAMRASGQRHILGLYSGGTLGAEAAMLIRNGLGLRDRSDHAKGVLLSAAGHRVIDLGDDTYTQGRPHPMIDPRTRVDMLLEAAGDSRLGIVLLDVVLGYGSGRNMAESLAEAISKVAAPVFIASICGTEKDPQDREKQRNILECSGVFVAETNAEAALLAVEAARYLAGEQKPPPACSEKILALMQSPKCVNLGLAAFSDAIFANNGQVVQFDWSPPAGGNEKMASLLTKLQ